MLAEEDGQHLRMLSIGHYVVAAMTFLFCSFPLIHLSIGVAMIRGDIPMGKGDEELPGFLPDLFGWVFAAVAGGMVLSGWALAVAMVVAGRRLSQRRSRVFCMVVAAIACMFMPLGTALGAFTIIVLMRPAVQHAFS